MVKQPTLGGARILRRYSAPVTACDVLLVTLSETSTAAEGAVWTTTFREQAASALGRLREAGQIGFTLGPRNSHLWTVTPLQPDLAYARSE